MGLRSLDLSHNQLRSTEVFSSLSDSLSQHVLSQALSEQSLPLLEVLDLSHNKLTKVRAPLAALAEL